MEWRIGTGRQNAFRPENTSSMRAMRNKVAKINKSGRDCIINVGGSGYFRPNPLDVEEDKMFHAYMASELHRAREILYKREQMKKAYALMKYEADKRR